MTHTGLKICQEPTIAAVTNLGKAPVWPQLGYFCLCRSHMVFSHTNHTKCFSTRAQYLPCPSSNESGPAGSRAACRASLCFSAEAGVCDEWAGDCRKRGTGLLVRALGSCWKKPSFPPASLTLCYLSFLFAFWSQVVIMKTWMVAPSPRGEG